MRRIAYVMPAAAVLAACRIGTSGSDLSIAKSPSGATASVHVTGGRSAGGELLSADADGLIVLVNRRVTRVPYAAIQSLSFAGLGGSYSYRGPTAPDVRKLRMLQTISRYGASLTPELQAQLLQAYGQTEMTGLQ